MELNNRKLEDGEERSDEVRVPLSARPRIAGRISTGRGMFGGWGPRIG